MSARQFEIRDAISIFSDPRGGSTWFMEMLCHLPHASPIFEPLHVRRGLIDPSLNFQWRQYIPKDAEWNDALNNFREIFQANRLNEWVVSRGRLRQYQNSQQLIFKFVRGNSLLPWLLNNIDFRHKPFLLLRHPVAVANSQIDRFEPQPSGESRPDRYAVYHRRHQAFLDTLESPGEKHVATWCLHNTPILNDPTSLENVTLIHYENLVRDPETQLASAFGSLEMSIPPSVASKIRKPSQSSSLAQFNADPVAQIEKWKSSISREQQERIQNVLDYFNITIYSADDPYPKSTTITKSDPSKVPGHG